MKGPPVLGVHGPRVSAVEGWNNRTRVGCVGWDRHLLVLVPEPHRPPHQNPSLRRRVSPGTEILEGRVGASSLCHGTGKTTASRKHSCREVSRKRHSLWPRHHLVEVPGRKVLSSTNGTGLPSLQSFTRLLWSGSSQLVPPEESPHRKLDLELPSPLPSSPFPSPSMSPDLHPQSPRRFHPDECSSELSVWLRFLFQDPVWVVVGSSSTTPNQPTSRKTISLLRSVWRLWVHPSLPVRGDGTGGSPVGASGPTVDRTSTINV